MPGEKDIKTLLRYVGWEQEDDAVRKRELHPRTGGSCSEKLSACARDSGGKNNLPSIWVWLMSVTCWQRTDFQYVTFGMKTANCSPPTQPAALGWVLSLGEAQLLMKKMFLLLSPCARQAGMSHAGWAQTHHLENTGGKKSWIWEPIWYRSVPIKLDYQKKVSRGMRGEALLPSPFQLLILHPRFLQSGFFSSCPHLFFWIQCNSHICLLGGRSADRAIAIRTKKCTTLEEGRNISNFSLSPRRTEPLLWVTANGYIVFHSFAVVHFFKKILCAAKE